MSVLEHEMKDSWSGGQEKQPKDTVHLPPAPWEATSFQCETHWSQCLEQVKHFQEQPV